MSDNANYLLSFGPVKDDGHNSDASLELEQEEHEKIDVADCIKEYLYSKGIDLELAGYISAGNPIAANLVSGLNAISSYTEAVEHCNSIHCNQDSGEFVTRIVVIRKPADLNYVIETSYGTITQDPIIEEIPYSKTEPISLKENFSPDVVFSGPPSAEWKGSVRGPGAVPITPPAITWNEEKELFEWGDGVKVFGALLIKGTKLVSGHVLTIPPREDEVVEGTEDAYESIVSAFWEDQVTQLTVKPPEISGNCAGVSVKIDPDDPDPEKCYIKHYEIDPCSGEKTDEWDTTETCPED